jgi:putative transposase
MFSLLLSELRVYRPGTGRARTTPDAVLGKKAYSSKAHRELLRSRGINAVILNHPPVRKPQTRGSLGGRPPAFDVEAYRWSQRRRALFQHVKQWRGLATR